MVVVGAGACDGACGDGAVVAALAAAARERSPKEHLTKRKPAVLTSKAPSLSRHWLRGQNRTLSISSFRSGFVTTGYKVGQNGFSNQGPSETIIRIFGRPGKAKQKKVQAKYNKKANVIDKTKTKNRQNKSHKTTSKGERNQMSTTTKK